MKFALTVLSLALFVSASTAQDGSVPGSVKVNFGKTKVVSIPDAAIPTEANGLGGKVSVYISINENGRATVGSVTGPDMVCPSMTRSDVIALRNAAGAAASGAVFGAESLDGKVVASNLWLEFDFPKQEKGKAPLTVGSSDESPGQIKGGVVNGKAISLPKPPYPPAARAVRASGAVNIQVLIDTDGKIFSAEPVSGHPLLRGAARQAACSAEFSPVQLSGKPVKVIGIITYNFVP